MTLGAALRKGRTGNLDALRLVLAAGVIVSHAWPLAVGLGTPEPLERLTGHSLGGWAVALFFFLSGLLVTASAERRGPTAFWTARARRIFPGLGVALSITLALAIASGATASASEAMAWFLRALTLVSIEHRLPGAFADNPMPEVVNGPLWSLFHEVAAYMICWVLVAGGGTRHRGVVVALIAAAALAALAAPALPGRAATFAPLFSAFALGISAHVFRDAIPLRPSVALILLPLAALAPWPVSVAALAYAALALALRAPELRLGGDYSFGLYIYGWPVAQTLVQAFPGIAPGALALASLAATLPLAVASWHLVERPVQYRRRTVA
jgi:peptidoglycan/LPS O-acetylase OafA/YrhL